MVLKKFDRSFVRSQQKLTLSVYTNLMPRTKQTKRNLPIGNNGGQYTHDTLNSALRNFESFHGLSPGSATIDQVSKSSLGVMGGGKKSDKLPGSLPFRSDTSSLNDDTEYHTLPEDEMDLDGLDGLDNYEEPGDITLQEDTVPMRQFQHKIAQR